MLPKVKEYIQKRKQIRTLDAKKNIVEEAASRLKDEIKDRELDKISEVQSQAASERSTVNEHAHDIIAPLIENVERLTLEIADVEQKIKHLKYREKIAGKTVQFDDSKAIAHRYELKPLGLLYEDEFTIMKLFAAENDRPKNCWTLMAIGDTLLRELVKTPHEYGLPIHTTHCIQKALKHLPTLEEIKAYVEGRRKDLMRGELAAYKEVKKAYLDTINSYSLEDFKPLLEPRKLSDHEAPVTFRITGIGDALEYRLYQGFYYRTGGEAAGDPFDYIEVDDVTYVRYCRPEQLRITETGNTMFGDWWSVSIRRDSRGIVFNRENWERTITEATAHIDEINVGRRKPVSFNPDKVEWITTIADEFFSTPKL